MVIDTRITPEEDKDPKNLAKPRTKQCEFWLAKKYYIDNLQDIIFEVRKIRQSSYLVNDGRKNLHASAMHEADKERLQRYLKNRIKYREILIDLISKYS